MMLLQRKGLKDLLREILLKDGDFDTADLSGIQKHGRFKNTLLDSIFEQLKEDVFPIERTGDKIIDLGLNYIYFAKSIIVFTWHCTLMNMGTERKCMIFHTIISVK